jgi:hypothetical protein
VAAPAPAPGTPPPFAQLIKDTKKTDGFFAAWQKDDKLWLEIQPEDFDRPFFLSPKLAGGIGEAGLTGGLMAYGVPRLVMLRRLNNLVQLVALNDDQVARAGTPEARAVEAATSVSLLGAMPVASQPHPIRKSVLVEANGLFIGEMLGLGASLQRSYRQGYQLDGRNSALTQVRGKPDLLVVEANLHYYAQQIQVLLPGMPVSGPGPSTPDFVPDPRSLFLKVHYSLMRLPKDLMVRRAADPRIGHFTQSVDDYSDDLSRTPRLRYINRWRLEKQDPQAALSPPVKPITYWLDRNVPLKYRDTIRDAVLEWNKAFERIGFQDAIVVRQQEDDADFDTLDADVASIRWMSSHAPGFGAIGPTHVDPRSGEILDADIGIESLSARSWRYVRSRLLPSDAMRAAAESGLPAPDAAALALGDAAALQAQAARDQARSAAWARLMQIGAPASLAGARGAALSAIACQQADLAAEQLGYAITLAAPAGELDPDSPQAEAFVQQYLRETVMHEVGHTLGLRHNFRASAAVPDAQVVDPAFSQAQAHVGSVMDYAAINLPSPGRPAPRPFIGTLGPYDYWAIEYAYRPLAADEEATALKAIAARSAEPGLAYGTDEDNLLGLDPESLQFDLGADPLAFAQRRFAIAADAFARQARRELPPDQDYAILRRSLDYALRDAGRAAGVLLRQIGGLRTLRDFPGSGRDPMQPVPVAQQRAALDLVLRTVLHPDAFEISPALQRRLAPDYQARGEQPGRVGTEYSVAAQLRDMQAAVLDRLMGDALSARLLDNLGRLDEPARGLAPAEVAARLQSAIWQELAADPVGGRSVAIGLDRRELQRGHVARLALLVQRPALLSRADTRAAVRGQAQALAARLEAAARVAGRDATTRAHLRDCAETLRAALRAQLQRA